MLQLDRVTLVCIDCLNYGSAISAIKKSMQQVQFKRVAFITDIDIHVNGVDTVIIPKIKSKAEYSYFIINNLYEHFDTDFCLIIQHDSWVLDADAWSDEYYNYDYIGAKWNYIDGRNVGNGGFSLRSHTLQWSLASDGTIDIYEPEDEVICRLYRKHLENVWNLKFAPEEVCDKFSFELTAPYQKTFGFHSFFHRPYRPTVVIQREAAMGDCITVEPVLAYFHKKGYQVVLDTLPQFEELFHRHYFPVLFPFQVDPKQLEHATVYNLNMSYESKPKENRLKTYYEFCGITDGEMVSPKLSLGFEPVEKYRLLNEKYVVLHLDKIAQPYRNIENIDWYKTVQLLRTKGYTIIQLGNGEHITITDTIEMNTVNLMLLMYVVAGADLFIGTDSGISHIAGGFNIPSIIFFGSVNPKIAHADLSNKICITNHEGKGCCTTPYCYHDSIGVSGQDCIVDVEHPPCVKFSTNDLITAINKFI